MASVGATVASTEAGELDGIDEFDETEDDETDGSGSDGTSIDGDPLDRYTVSSVAGKEVGREDDGPGGRERRALGSRLSPRFRLGVSKGLDSYFASKRMNSGSGKSDSRGLAIETAPHGRTDS